MKKSAIIFDIDGTAIDSPVQKIPTERLINAVSLASQNYYLCAATGRAWSFAKPVLKGLKLIDPCIISGGTQICDPGSGKIFWQCDIEPANLDAVIAIAKQFPDQKVLFNDYTDEDYLYGGFLPKDLHINEDVYMFNIKLVPPEIAQKIVEKISLVNGLTCIKIIAQRPELNDIHILNNQATKEHAIAELINMLKIDRENTIGVGDGHNDIHLFNGVRHKIAVENAVPEIKSIADEIIGNVKDDGFAAYLETLT